MSVETVHPLYTENLPLWEKVRACVSGQADVKAQGNTYLPEQGKTGSKPEDVASDKARYEAYIKRAVFTGFTTRTAEGLYGQVFAKEPEKTGEHLELFDKLLSNVDKGGTSLDQFSSDLVWDNIQAPWGGILVDHSPNAEGLNQAEKEKLGMGAFMRRYPAESADNFRYGTVNDKSTLVMVKLKENYQVVTDDEFNPADKIRYRVLRLVDGKTLLEPVSGAAYIQEIWEQTDEGEWVITDSFTPKIEGKPLDFIPFFLCPANDPDKSMLLPVADQNISHYQLDAELKNILHLHAMPTGVLLGVDPPMKTIKTSEGEKTEPADIVMGKMLILKASGEGTPNAKYMEPAGTGAAQISAKMENIEKLIELMGATFYKKTRGQETATAAKIHQAGENAVLGSYALNMSEKITGATRLYLWWSGIPKEIADLFTYALNMDYEYDISMVDERNIGIREVDAGLKSRLTYIMETTGKSEEEAKAEIELIDGEKEPVTDNFDFSTADETVNPQGAGNDT
jgi:hypothetical protein